MWTDHEKTERKIRRILGLLRISSLQTYGEKLNSGRKNADGSGNMITGFAKEEREMSLISGIHHVAFKCRNEEEYKETIHFYKDVLGLTVARSWETGIMLDTGAGLIEIFSNGEDHKEQGVIRHFALETEDVESCVRVVREAGYEVFIEPKDIVITSEPPFPARIAFCRGPLQEEIEFFQEKK